MSCTRFGTALTLLLLVGILSSGCISRFGEYQNTSHEIQGLPEGGVLNFDENSGSCRGDDGRCPVGTVLPTGDTEERKPEKEKTSVIPEISDQELLFIQERSIVYLAHYNEIPVLFDTNGSGWSDTTRKDFIGIALNDSRVRESIENGGMIIGVSICLHPTPKDSTDTGGPALRILNNGTVTDYVVCAESRTVCFQCIGPIEQDEEFRQKQLDLNP